MRSRVARCLPTVQPATSNEPRDNRGARFATQAISSSAISRSPSPPRHAEAIVDAELDDMHVLVDVDPHILLAACAVEAHVGRDIDGLGAEVHVVVYQLGRPVMPQRPLGAATNHPAGA